VRYFILTITGQLLTLIGSYAFSINVDTLFWIQKGSIFQYASCNLIRSTKINDNKLTLIRFNPSIFDVDLIEYKKSNLLKTADYWVDSSNYNLVVNAGMYDINNEHKHCFYMQNVGVINNPILNPNAKGIIAFNPIFDTISNFDLFDLSVTSFANINKNYQTIIQGFRLIDDEGHPVFWDKNNQFCSMVVIAEDCFGFIYIIFCRSPLTHNQMTENLLSLDLGLRNAIYLEGGSKAAFSISVGDFKMNKMGSYVSNYYPFDNNFKMPQFPNYIGFKKRN
jgi:hypothetical protein